MIGNSVWPEYPMEVKPNLYTPTNDAKSLNIYELICQDFHQNTGDL